MVSRNVVVDGEARVWREVMSGRRKGYGSTLNVECWNDQQH